MNTNKDIVCYDWLRLGVSGSEPEAVFTSEKERDTDVEVAIIDTTSILEAVTG